MGGLEGSQRGEGAMPGARLPLGLSPTCSDDPGVKACPVRYPAPRDLAMIKVDKTLLL